MTPPAAVDPADTQEAPEEELTAAEEPEAQPAADVAALPVIAEEAPVVVDAPAEDAPAEEVSEEVEAPAENTEETAEDTEEAENKTEEIVIARPDASVPAVQPAEAAPAVQPGGISMMLPTDSAPTAINMGDAVTVGENDSTIYSSLQDAIDTAQDGDEIKLEKDYTGNLSIAKWIKLNLNKHTINGTVTIDTSKKNTETANDETSDTAHKVEIVDGTITGGTDSGVKIEGAGETNVLLKDLTIEGNTGEQGGGVLIKDSQNVTIDNCTIQGNKTTKVSYNEFPVDTGAGGGVLIENSNVTIKNSTIQNNTATRGGGVYTESSTVTVENSHIDNNTATDVPSDTPDSDYGLGGGIYSFDSTLNVTGGTINSNEAKGSSSLFKYKKDGGLASSALGMGGGGICAVGKKSDVTLDSAEVKGNKATFDDDISYGAGGGIDAEGGKLTIKNNTTISQNTARGSGGGIFSGEGNQLVVSDSTLQGNEAEQGGGILLGEARDSKTTPSSALLTNTKILNNKTTSFEGGGMFVGSYATATLKDCTVNDNTSASYGGGIANILSTITLDSTTVKGNTAAYGGGLYSCGYPATSTKVILTNKTTVTENNADYGAGMFIWSQGGDPVEIQIDDSSITGNIATNYGGGIYASNSKLTANRSDISGNTATAGGGAYLTSSNGTFTNVTFSGNQAANAGALFLYLNGHATLNNTQFIENTASNYGGAIGIWDSTCSVTDTKNSGTVLKNNNAKYGGAIYNGGTLTLEKGTTVAGNSADVGGGLYSAGKAIISTGCVFANNSATEQAADLYITGKGSTLTLTPTGDGWVLNECGHEIVGWFLDGLDARWDADGEGKHVIDLDDFKADGYAITKNEDGSYTITILSDDGSIALKAAHDVIPEPTPDPDPEPTPDPVPTPVDPDQPDNPVSPEDPTDPPVQDATPDEAVTPENPTNPPVQDATPDSTVAALPKTGVNWLAAAAMALSGLTLMAAGAFTSLFAKSKH